MMNPDFWKGRKVFVTGHTGFKGAWLTLWLKSAGAHVKGYSLPAPTDPSLFVEARVADGIESETGDIRDLERLRSSLAAFAPEIVLHLAAQSLVRLSYEDPVATFATNIMGTVHLLEAARYAGSVRAIVNVTSDKCYENREWTWGYRENDAMGGHDPYSSSKGCAELVAAAYRRSFLRGEIGPHLASVRAGNVIGGGDWARDRLVPDLLRAFESRTPVVIRNPGATRPWQHVLEPLSGYLAIAEKLHGEGAAWAEGWNFGPEPRDVRPVRWIVEHMVGLWGEGAEWRLSGESHVHEAGYLGLDCSKARQVLRWTPRWTLETSLGRIVDWTRARLEGGDVRALCEREIQDYQVARPALE